MIRGAVTHRIYKIFSPSFLRTSFFSRAFHGIDVLGLRLVRFRSLR